MTILALLTVGLTATDDASALPMHSLDVSLEPAQLDAKVTEGKEGSVTFGGNVSIDKQQGVERVTVSLTADCGNGWEAIVSPATMTFINPGTQRFSLTVVVPEGTPVSSATTTVYAHAESPIWEEDKSASTRVNVLQYFKLEVTAQQVLLEGEAGGTVMGKLLVNNSGNGDDNFAFSVEDAPKGVEKWHFNEEQLLIPRGLSAEVTYTLFIDEDLEVGQDGLSMTVVFKVTSLVAEQAGIHVSKTYPITIYCQGWEEHLREEWPTYVSYGVIAAAVIVPAWFLIRWRRRRRSERAPVVEVETE